LNGGHDATQGRRGARGQRNSRQAKQRDRGATIALSSKETTVTYETIKYEQRGKTACITLNRPDKHNAINGQMEHELGQAFRSAEADENVWTIIYTGAGDKALCTGADVGSGKATTNGIVNRGEPLLKDMRQWETPQEASPPYLQMAKPIICAVNGMCAGAGLDLVTTSDIAIAADTASFFDPHVSIGIVSGREMVRVARALPLNIAMRMALMGKHERLSAQRAYELGMISEVVPAAKLMERAWEIAELVNRNAPLAVRGTRMGIRKGLSLPVYEAELVAESYRMRVAQTEDALEGPRSFKEKRAPKWEAR
jgi:enoyl-CoA hydratase/carnithine racemase